MWDFLKDIEILRSAARQVKVNLRKKWLLNRRLMERLVKVLSTPAKLKAEELGVDSCCFGTGPRFSN